MKTLSESLFAWLDRIERLHAKPIDLGLDRVRAVANRLDLRLHVPTIVVGGTNGKGSTCAMLDAMLRAAGYRVGLYTSRIYCCSTTRPSDLGDVAMTRDCSVQSSRGREATLSHVL